MRWSSFTYLLLDLLPLLESLLQLGLQVADLGQVLGRLQAGRSGFSSLNKPPRLNAPLSDLGHGRLVLLHQVVQVLLVLLHPRLEVVLLPLEPTQLLLQLRNTSQQTRLVGEGAGLEQPPPGLRVGVVVGGD